MKKVGMRATALRLVAAGGLAAAVMLPGAAFAQTGCPYGSGDCKPPATPPAPPEEGNEGGLQAAPPAEGDTLPFTGGDVVGLALIGAGAVVGGAALARSGRRKQAEV
jgi:hypothetical protein